MNRRILARALPTIAVLALLCLAAAGPAPPAMGPAPPPPLYPPCDQFMLSGGGDSSTDLVAGQGLFQPLPSGISASSCSLRVQGMSWSFGRLNLEQWDPLTLAPDPSSVALRTVSFDPSTMLYYTLNRFPRWDLVPPLVTRSVDGVAEPTRLTTSLAVSAYGSLTRLRAYHDPASASVMPGARVASPLGGSVPMPGDHPVLAHAICGADADFQELRVAQSVMHTDVLLSALPEELAQRFRVPEPVELRWVELAVGPTPATAFVPAVVGIVDGQGLPDPPQTMPATLVEAFFSHYLYGDIPRWGSHMALDRAIVLQPHRDYWLYVRSAQGHAMFARTLSGAEGDGFAAGVGPFLTRAVAAAPWTAEASRVLSFRIVGRPMGSQGVVPPARPSGFALRVAPNPAPGVADVSWSGAVGPVRLEVFDARGRRVARVEAGAAGAWRWTAAGSNGAPLPAGFYFVHARDSAGGRAVERLVIVR